MDGTAARRRRPPARAGPPAKAAPAPVAASCDAAKEHVMPKVICMGEILIDFVSTQEGVTVGDAPGFEKKPGGAPANVAVGLARLGVAAGFVGKVGRDAFGDFLRRTLEENRVDARLMLRSDSAHTTLAFVSLAAGGERSFVFYRNPGADTLLEPSEIDAAYFSGAAVFHFGSLSLTHEPARAATLRALDLAEKTAILISYDPNLREALWPNLETARETMLSVLPRAHLLKISEEEALFLTRAPDPVEGARRLLAMGPRLVLLTKGPGGCALLRQGLDPIHLDGFSVRSVDTTGAGDAFVAAVLAQLIDARTGARDLGAVGGDALRRIGLFANAAGALTTTQKGAIPALPTREAVARFLAERK
jgi:sugar/nucleoside kinase (ribokinase family)